MLCYPQDSARLAGASGRRRPRRTSHPGRPYRTLMRVTDRERAGGEGKGILGGLGELHAKTPQTWFCRLGRFYIPPCRGGGELSPRR